MRRTVTRVPARLVVTVATAMVAIVVGSCGSSSDLVIGTFDGGKLIALDKSVGTNSVGTGIGAYAEVADQTPGNFDINGPQHWRCAGVFRAAAQIPASGSLFKSDQDRLRDKAVNLPSLVLAGETRSTSRTGSDLSPLAGMGFTGPAGTYRVTIEVPSLAVKFSHSWKLGGGGGSPTGCTQIADTLAQQRSLADEYLSALQYRLNRASPSPIRAQLQALLDQARQAKVSGDGRADPDERTADYQSAVAILTKMVRLAGDSVPPPNPPWELSRSDIFDITRVATNGAALLSETGLR